MASSRHCLRATGTPAALLLLALCTTNWATDFAGGTGEPNDPYQIATAEQLLAMDDDPNLYDKHFALVADIDLDPALPGRKVFPGPILHWPSRRSRLGGGGSGSGGSGMFEGGFDGDGHTIRNGMHYNTSSYPDTGLFDFVGPLGRIRNLHLEDVLIVGASKRGSYCGALAGENAGFIASCSVTGTILADSADYAPFPGGGLIGYSSGIIVDCHAECYVFGEQVGGLVGTNGETGRIVLCSSNGITIGDEMTGGLVGTNAGMVQYSFAEGNVLGHGTGGLVGSNSGTVRENYASGLGSWGSLIGTNSGTVANCYAAGTALVDSYRALPGGLVGTNDGSIVSSYSARVLEIPGAVPEPLPLAATPDYGDDVRQNYYLVVEKPASMGLGDRFMSSGTPLLAEEMQQQANFPGLDFVGDANDGAQDHWFMPESGYPILTWQTEITGLAGIPDVSGLTLERAQELLTSTGFVPDAVSYDYARPQEVCDRGDCQWVSTEGQVLYTRPATCAPPASSVEIVVSAGPYDFESNPGDGSESNPYQIGTAGQLDSLYSRADLWASHFVLTADLDLTYRTYPRALIEEFSGAFDGNSHSIRYRGQNGLIGVIEPNAIVHNLALESACISTIPESRYVGILAGQNDGRIHNCTASGRIFGGDSYIGGLIGGNDGQVSDCIVSIQIFAGYDYIGGLAGWNEGEISHCTVSSKILGGYSEIGGLVGNNAGQILNCRVRGQVLPEAGSGEVGGLVGRNTQSIAGSCVVETTVSGEDYIGGLVGINFGTDARIETSYAQGDVCGETYVGGLVGANIRSRFRRTRSVTMAGETAAIRDCYSTSSVSGQDDTGGCLGYVDPNALAEGCYFLDPTDGGGPDNGYGTALSTEQMWQQASFTGWDFQTVWTICEGEDYPRLRWEGVQCQE